VNTPRSKHLLRSRNQSCLPAGAFHAALLLIAGALFLSQTGCTTRHYTVNQYGWNHVDAEVLKEMDISPTVKASLK
jgi:hypothetical protein